MGTNTRGLNASCRLVCEVILVFVRFGTGTCLLISIDGWILVSSGCWGCVCCETVSPFTGCWDVDLFWCAAGRSTIIGVGSMLVKSNLSFLNSLSLLELQTGWGLKLILKLIIHLLKLVSVNELVLLVEMFCVQFLMLLLRVEYKLGF